MLAEAATYLVSVRWPAGLADGTTVTYRVTHDGGTTDVALDQRTGGGAWRTLGAFAMTPGQGHGVTLLGAAPEPDGEIEVIVDQDDPGTARVGTWPIGNTASAWNGSHRYNLSGTGANTLTWPLAITESGTYEVYARWVAYSNRATDAPYTIHHDGGTTTIDVNQQVNGSQWNLLGSFAFSVGGDNKVVLSDDANNTLVTADAIRATMPAFRQPVVAADAVRFERYQSPQYPVASSTLTREYVTLDGLPLALIEGGAIHTVHADHLGAPQKMTDANRQLVWDAVLRPFGEAHAISGSATNPQRFPGQYADAATGLHYNYLRDYDPSLGRYLEPDPIGLKGGLNTYGYVGGDPVNRIDPRGLDALLIGAGATTTVGGGFDVSGGVAVDLDTHDRALFYSVGVTAGANLSSDVFLGYFWTASLCELQGRAKLYNLVLGPLSISVFFDDRPGFSWPLGFTAGYGGPGFPAPVMASGGFVDTIVTPFKGCPCPKTL